MVATLSDIAALESFFASIDLPSSLTLNPAVVITDLLKFVRTNLQKIKEGIMTDAVVRPRYEDSLLIRKILTPEENTSPL